MKNMSIEDILNELGGYGIVNLRKGKFTKGASPHLRGQPELWELEIRLPGYSSPYATVSDVKVKGSTIKEVAEAAYSALEAFIFSHQAIEDRQRYEKNLEFYRDRYDKATEYERNSFDPVRHPGESIPPIVWGKPRGGKIL